MKWILGVLLILFLSLWAILHGGTKGKQPTVEEQKTLIEKKSHVYYDDHDVSGLLEED